MSLRSRVRSLFLVAAAAALWACRYCRLTPASLSLLRFAPPALPVYVQPPLPAPGFIWTPGYWAYGDAGYYWVPGVWVRLRELACFGRPVTGDLPAAFMRGIPATGVRMWASTVA